MRALRFLPPMARSRSLAAEILVPASTTRVRSLFTRRDSQRQIERMKRLRETS